MTVCDVAIVGAGPYGLSIAAHLKAQGTEFRIFGSPMHTWLNQMPRGMRLKSEGFASSLYEPKSQFTLREFCRQNGLPYADVGLPVPLETFTSYGLEFQKRYVPQLENKLVSSLRRNGSGFEIELGGSETFRARRVVMAVGLTHYAYTPEILATLPREFVSHSSDHSTLDNFKGRAVAVVGAGASALDLAALLHQVGCTVQVVARNSIIRFHDPAVLPRPLVDQIRAPMTGIGSGWKLMCYANAPRLFHHLPERFRLDAVRRTLGPAPGWFIKQDVVGKVPFNLGVEITEARVCDGRLQIQLTNAAGTRKALVVDNVIAATGYRVNLRRLKFMDEDLRSSIRSVEETPILSRHFESSVTGLYFVGASSANSFGPLMRFAFGARYAASQVSQCLQK